MQARNRPTQRSGVEGTGEISIELSNISGRTPHSRPIPKSARASRKDKREKQRQEKMFRKAGDGVGGGAGNYFRILKYGKALDYVLMSVGAAAAFVTGIAFPVMVILLGSFVNQFFRLAASGDSDILTKETASLCLKFIYLFLAKWLTSFISMTCFRITSIRISSTLRLSYITSIFRQDLTYFDTLALNPVTDADNQLSTDHTNPAVHKPGTPGSVAVSITTVTSTVQMGIGERIGSVCQSLAMLIAGFGIALDVNWRLTLASSAVIPVAIIGYGISIPLQVKYEKRILMAYTKAADLAEEVLSSIRTIQSFNAERVHANKYDELLARAKTEGVRKSPLIGLQFFLGAFIMFSAYTICFRYGVSLFMSGRIETPGEILVVFFSTLFGIGSFAALATPIQAMAKASAAAAIIFQVVDRPPLIDPLSDEGESPLELPTGDIEFRNIQFAYPGGGNRNRSVVLGGKIQSTYTESLYLENENEGSAWDADGLTLSFPRNKTTAIVGSSGAGKSTIVALLERWYEPQMGSISIGEADIEDFNLRYWRGKIGLVTQEPFLFNDTIYQNVAYGLQGTAYEGVSEAGKRQLVHEACTEANAAEFINELPDGYNSLVGEGGIKLSGGQKQRIAIARSIISKPPILILDEATSALDPINEKLVHKALDTISRGRTTIIIAHRLSTLKDADKIIVLEKGNVVESGTHVELMGSPTGVYRASVGMQSLVIDAIGEQNPFENTDDPEDQGEDIVVTRADDEERLLGPTGSKVPLEEPVQKGIGFFALILLIMREQSKLWPVYTAGLAGSLGAGIVFPMSALLLASFLTTFDLVSVGEMVLFNQTSSFWAHMFMILAVGSGLMFFIMGFMLTRSSYISGSNYRSEYFRNVLSQKIPFFDKPSNSSGEITSRLNIYPGAVQELIGAPVGLIASSFATFVSSCVISIYVCPRLAGIIILACVPLNLLAGWARICIERRFVTDSLKVFAESSQFATEAVGAYRTVSSLCLERLIVHRFRTLLGDHVKKQSFRVLWSSIFYSATESTSILVSAFTFWWGGCLILQKEISVFQFYVVYLTVIQGGDAVGSMFTLANKIALAVHSANKMFEIRPRGSKPLGKRLNSQETGGCGIQFQKVDFRYQNRSFNVLSGLNLKVEKGQFAALVGPSGCGKTTIISLLERFYDVSGGDILIDGLSLASMDVSQYRNIVSLVAQEPAIYRGTIRENICIGARPGITEEEIIQASRDSYLHDFISSLPDGYNTLCGNRGIGLSGGQKQRLSIARAFIRKPRILLLDEATASLDSKSERIVQNALEGIGRAGGNRQTTVIAVAHRISSIKNADVIFVLDEGRVIETGTHDTLIRKGGMYFEMCRAQALDR